MYNLFERKNDKPVRIMASAKAKVNRTGDFAFAVYSPQFDCKIENIEFDGFAEGTRVQSILAADFVLLQNPDGVLTEKITELDAVKQDDPINMPGGLQFQLVFPLEEGHEYREGDAIGEVHFVLKKNLGGRSFHEIINDYARLVAQRDALMTMLTEHAKLVDTRMEVFETMREHEDGPILLDLWDPREK